MKKLVFYPQYHKGKASNPYCDNYIDAIRDFFEIIPKSKHTLPRGFELLINSTKADVYILNWLESISALRIGWFQAVMGILALYIIHFRKTKIIWMFHNIHPHEGENKLSRIIQHLLFKWSSLIVSHSKEAVDYAKHKSKCPVMFKHHPMLIKEYGVWKENIKECDFFLWGDIYPYKGVVELLNNTKCQQSGAHYYIVGKPTSPDMEKQIKESLTDNVLYENRRADYKEIAAQCKKAKYVLFPYVGNSISSSGVLMDTIMMGGIPVGPNQGAFADLATEGCCITYNKLEDIVNLPLDDEHRIRLNQKKIEDFINENSWDAYGKWFVTQVGRI